MPRLTDVRLSLGLELEVTFGTSKPILEACDTAVLLIHETGGSEFTIRIERGRVEDASLWDAGRTVRQSLPTDSVSVTASGVTCSIPRAILPWTPSVPGLSAALVVNGAPVQSGVAVTLRSAFVDTVDLPAEETRLSA
jgi:hypothetical protein